MPILGICYGLQLAAEALGAQVQANPARGEYGRTECRVLDPHDPIFHDVPRETIVWMSHGDQIHEAGGDFIPLAATPHLPDRGGPPPQRCRSTACSSTPRSRTRRMAR